MYSQIQSRDTVNHFPSSRHAVFYSLSSPPLPTQYFTARFRRVTTASPFRRFISHSSCSSPFPPRLSLVVCYFVIISHTHHNAVPPQCSHCRRLPFTTRSSAAVVCGARAFDNLSSSYPRRYYCCTRATKRRFRATITNSQATCTAARPPRKCEYHGRISNKAFQSSRV